MSSFSFATDEDTRRLFECVAWCLKRFFSYSDDSATDSIRTFYTQNAHRYDDDFYHREMPYHVALRVHYDETLKGKPDHFVQWRRSNTCHEEMHEALEYFRRHYFD